MVMFEPDDFAGDAYGHLTNQASHGGFLGAWLGLLSVVIIPPYAAWLVVTALYWLVWERIWQGGKDWRDSFEDSAHVGAGAALQCVLYSPETWLTAVIIMTAWSALIGLGVWRRL